MRPPAEVRAGPIAEDEIAKARPADYELPFLDEMDLGAIGLVVDETIAGRTVPASLDGCV